MIHAVTRHPLGCALLLIQLLAAGCGGGGDSNAGVPPSSPKPPASTPPTITSILPGNLIAGAFDPVVYVDGTGFTPDSRGAFNGDNRPTAYITESRIKIELHASDVASPGSASLSVTNAGGESSAAMSIAIRESNYIVREVAVPSPLELVSDSSRGVLYVLTSDGRLGTVDPMAGTVEYVPAPGNGGVRIALSDDNQYLYLFGLGAIQRLTLPDFMLDAVIPGDSSGLAVAPESARTIAVAGFNGASVTIIDDTTPRPVQVGVEGIAVSDLAWGVDATTLYGRASLHTSNDLYRFEVDTNGVTASVIQKYPVSEGMDAQGIVFDQLNRRIHLGNGWGLNGWGFSQVVDGDSMQWAGRFDAPGLATVDPQTSKAFLLFYTIPANATIAAYDLATYAFLGAVSFPQVGVGIGPRMVRWGSEGLAYITGDQVTLVHGAFVSERTPAVGELPPVRTTVAGQQVMVLPQAADDIIGNPSNDLVYLAVPGLDRTHSNSILAMDPRNGQVLLKRQVISNPRHLVMSDNGQFLYAWLLGSGSIQRFSLPSLTPEPPVPLGWFESGGARIALDLTVAPGAPGTVAVALGTTDVISPATGGAITVYDDGVPRPVSASQPMHFYNALRWSDTSTLYAANGQNTALELYVLGVGPDGVWNERQHYGAFSGFLRRIHYSPITDRVYGDDGSVVDPATGTRVGSLGGSGLIAIDATLNKAWLIPPLPFPDSMELVIRSVDLTTFATIDTLTLPKVHGRPIRLVRWGADGLAFNTEFGQLYIVSGSFVN